MGERDDEDYQREQEVNESNQLGTSSTGTSAPTSHASAAMLTAATMADVASAFANSNHPREAPSGGVAAARAQSHTSESILPPQPTLKESAAAAGTSTASNSSLQSMGLKKNDSSDGTTNRNRDRQTASPLVTPPLGSAKSPPLDSSGATGTVAATATGKQRTVSAANTHNFVVDPQEIRHAPPNPPQVRLQQHSAQPRISSLHASLPSSPSEALTVPSVSSVAPQRSSSSNAFSSSSMPVAALTAAAAAAATTTSTSASSAMSGSGQRRGIPHVYHDYSRVSGPSLTSYIRKKTGGVTQPFPEKLHEMLLAESNTSDPNHLSTSIVSWLPHGRAFIVRKPKEFTSRIMPKYFRQTKLTSFQRQLNLYGFRRLTVGPDAGAYYHELFLRGRPSLSQRMVRQKVKGTFRKQPADASSEPNFYAMPPVQSEGGVAALNAEAAQSASVQPASPQHNVYGQQQYGSPPQQPAHSIFPTSSSVAAGPATVTASQPTQTVASGFGQNPALPTSPGLASLHGAAHVLQGFASGFKSASSSSSNAVFLGPAASTAANTAAAMAGVVADEHDRKLPPQQQIASRSAPASFLPPDAQDVGDDEDQEKQQGTPV